MQSSGSWFKAPSLYCLCRCENFGPRFASRLLAFVNRGDDTGIYQITLKDQKRVPLAPGVATFGTHYSPDGNSVLYAVSSRGEITFYRQLIQGEKAIGKPQIALELPFTFPLSYNGNAFDFSPDLSTVVYARPAAKRISTF